MGTHRVPIPGGIIFSRSYLEFWYKILITYLQDLGTPTVPYLSEERQEELRPKDYATRYPTTRSNASRSEQEVMWAPPKWESRMADEERETLLSGPKMEDEASRVKPA